jgi:hypothetical protein
MSFRSAIAAVTFGVVFTASTPVAQPQLLSDLTVVLLGTGGTLPTMRRFGPATLVRATSRPSEPLPHFDSVSNTRIPAPMPRQGPEANNSFPLLPQERKSTPVSMTSG